ncbi:hypothetical protein M1771_08815 [Spiroplasma citri]|uniref:hypothetical protein n=1 Tax=Spiroplasma citri TaxID=2133 RepID=UPI002412A49C|nr:hypothetical protein [Spiroplasma citri]WFH00070.1 hypothetical protein M1771_08815 [Spiroplasma citri]
MNLVSYTSSFCAIYHVWKNLHCVIEVQQINFERSWFFIEKKHYFIFRSLVTKVWKRYFY